MYALDVTMTKATMATAISDKNNGNNRTMTRQRQLHDDDNDKNNGNNLTMTRQTARLPSTPVRKRIT